MGSGCSLGPGYGLGLGFGLGSWSLGLALGSRDSGSVSSICLGLTSRAGLGLWDVRGVVGSGLGFWSSVLSSRASSWAQSSAVKSKRVSILPPGHRTAWGYPPWSFSA